MSSIIIKKLSPDELKALGTESWSPWSCEKSTFEWSYDGDETCYFLAGRARIKAGAQTVEVSKGDVVTFPDGLRCTWEVLEPVRKLYTYDSAKALKA